MYIYTLGGCAGGWVRVRVRVRVRGVRRGLGIGSCQVHREGEGLLRIVCGYVDLYNDAIFIYKERKQSAVEKIAWPRTGIISLRPV